MKKICVLTATRAEYGLLRPVIRKLMSVPEFDVRVAVTGAHLSAEFGFTYQEIEQDGIIIDEKIDILLSSDTPASVTKSMGLALISFAGYFDRLKPDLFVVLGDRYETLAVCIAAMNQRIPIAHLYGGEITVGAVDDSIRHAITKLSYLHFTSTEEYRSRVIQLGEQPDRVHCVGAVGIENIRNESLLTEKELREVIHFPEGSPYAVVTFHPVTLEEDSAGRQFRELLRALSEYKSIGFIFTKANADANGRIVNRMIDEYAAENKNTIAFTSMGSVRYLSALKYSKFVIGNSSSGLLEAPSFGIPTVNIGDRQKGRLQAGSVINCEPVKDDIKAAIERALSDEFAKIARCTKNPYGDGNTSEKIAEHLRTALSGTIDLKKIFYDCKVN